MRKTKVIRQTDTERVAEMDRVVKGIRQTDTERVAEIDKDESNQTDGHRESGRD